jgi:predicted deacetylase
VILLVSIHDVSPAQEPNVLRLWDLCAKRGVTPALLVVPNWHGEWPLHDHPRFINWVLARAEDGAEIVLHGERHDENGLPRRLAHHWRAWGRTDEEGEFLTLDGPEAGERVTRGLAQLRDIGLDPTGFVPPAWLACEAAYQAAAAAGLAFSEDDHCVRLLPSGRRVNSPVTRWSTRTPLRAWGSVAVAAGRWMFQRGAEYPRIALHPGDVDHVATAQSIERTLDRWLGQHSAGRYADLPALTWTT